MGDGDVKGAAVLSKLRYSRRAIRLVLEAVAACVLADAATLDAMVKDVKRGRKDLKEVSLLSKKLVLESNESNFFIKATVSLFRS